MIVALLLAELLDRLFRDRYFRSEYVVWLYYVYDQDLLSLFCCESRRNMWDILDVPFVLQHKFVLAYVKNLE